MFLSVNTRLVTLTVINIIEKFITLKNENSKKNSKNHLTHKTLFLMD